MVVAGCTVRASDPVTMLKRSSKTESGPPNAILGVLGSRRASAVCVYRGGEKSIFKSVFDVTRRRHAPTKHTQCWHRVPS